MSNDTVRFKDWEAERLRDPEFRAAYEELEPAHQEARRQIMDNLCAPQPDIVKKRMMHCPTCNKEQEFLCEYVECMAGRGFA